MLLWCSITILLPYKQQLDVFRGLRTGKLKIKADFILRPYGISFLCPPMLKGGRSSLETLLERLVVLVPVGPGHFAKVHSDHPNVNWTDSGDMRGLQQPLWAPVHHFPLHLLHCSQAGFLLILIMTVSGQGLRVCPRLCLACFFNVLVVLQRLPLQRGPLVRQSLALIPKALLPLRCPIVSHVSVGWATSAHLLRSSTAWCCILTQYHF